MSKDVEYIMATSESLNNHLANTDNDLSGLIFDLLNFICNKIKKLQVISKMLKILINDISTQLNKTRFVSFSNLFVNNY